MELDKKIKILNTIKMSASERNRIRGALVGYMQLGRSPRHSPYVTKSPYLFLSIHQGSRALAFLLILAVILGSGGSLSFAASRALPGDLLYPVKVSVNEELAVSFAGTVEKKVEVQKARIKTRLEEATTLKATGKFTPDNTKIVQKAFVDQALELNSTIDSLQESGNEETVLAVTQDLLPTLVSFKEASAVIPVPDESVATIDGTTIDSVLTDTVPLIISIDTQDPLETTPVSTSEQATVDETDPVLAISLDVIVAREVEQMQLQQAETLEKIKIIDSTSPEKPLSLSTAEIEDESTNEIISEVAVEATPVTEESLIIDESIATNTLPTPETSISSMTLPENLGEPIAVSNITEKITSIPLLKETAVKSTSSLKGTIYLNKPCLTTVCTLDVDNSFTRSLLVYTEDKSEIIAQIKVTENGVFSATLKPGTYVLDLVKNGTDTTDDLPETITIPSSGSVVLSVTINTK